ncbi:MAG TPA: DUF2849 domain-containing protein [Beijerinckiaceae bacterium]|jgi:hypothetical protein
MKHAISANRLADGTVVFFKAPASWAERLEDAALYDDAAAAEAALETARADERRNVVVEPYVFAVRDGAGAPKADHIREAIRAAGPTVRRDLGKQALGRPS